MTIISAQEARKLTEVKEPARKREFAEFCEKIFQEVMTEIAIVAADGKDSVSLMDYQTMGVMSDLTDRLIVLGYKFNAGTTSDGKTYKCGFVCW